MAYGHFNVARLNKVERFFMSIPNSVKSSILAVALFLATALSPHANASVVLDNQFPDPTAGMQILQQSLSSTNWRATPITTDGFDYTLNSITANIQDFNPAGTLFLEIWSVDTSLTYGPGAIIGRLQLTDNQPSMKVFSTNLSPINLSANTSYFVVTGVDNGGGQWYEKVNLADPLGPNFQVMSGTWLLQTNGPSSAINESFNGTVDNQLQLTWQSAGLLRAPLRMTIDATAVPEPSTWALLGLGVLISPFLLRRRD
jgi:hypothetical protein